MMLIHSFGYIENRSISLTSLFFFRLQEYSPLGSTNHLKKIERLGMKSHGLKFMAMILTA